MNPHLDLKELSTRESEQVEWKRNVADIEDLLRTVTAFANDYQNLGGGYIVCGAEELRDEHGFPRVETPGLTSNRFKEIEGKLMNDSRTKIDPPVTPLVEELPGSVEGQRILIFIVPASPHPHCYRASGADASRYYVRLSRETIEARNGILRELLVRKQAIEPWDRRPNPDATLTSIDLLAFRDVLQQAAVWNPSMGMEDYFEERNRLSALVPSLGARRPLDTNLRPRNFALILFAKEPTTFIPGAWTKVSAYPGKDRSEPTAERHEITGSVVEQARKALDLLKTHASTAFDKESPDPNAPKYPERALQEAVINAIVHRDYEINEPTNITIFADRIEIRSPGGLPRTVDREKFLQGSASPSWRNQSLAWFFNKLQLAQAEGQGIPTIFRTMLQLGSPTPTFDLEESAVTCILPAHPRHEMLRHVAEVERLLIQQDFEAAEARLVPLLEKQPAAPRLLELLSQIATTQNRPEWIGEWIRRHKLAPQDLPASTIFLLSDALRESASIEDKTLGKSWIETVSSRRLQGDEVKRAALALRKMGRDEDAVRLITNLISRTSNSLTIPAMLYDIRARAKIDLAKRCMDTGRSRQVDKNLQAKAWEQCRRYLEEAESDIIKAVESEPNGREREFYEKDLEFVRNLMKQSQKPERQPNRNQNRGPKPGSRRRRPQ